MTLLTSQFDVHLIGHLLAAARARGGTGAEEAPIVEYDWKAPCRFTPDQVSRLEKFAKDMAASVSTALGEVLRVQTPMESAGVRQHYAPDLQAWQGQADAYCVALADGETRCGLVALNRSCAAGWVGRLLGAASGDLAEVRELTSVETAILLDMLATVTDAFSQTFQKAGGKKLAAVSGLLEGQEIEDLIGRDPTKDYCKIALRPAEADAQPILTFVVTCEAMEGVAGGTKGKAATASPEAVRKAVMACLEQAPIAVRIRLGESQVTMGDLMRLEAGDVLLLNKGVDEPAEVLVEGRPVMTGFPSTCQGQYALRIAARVGGGTKK